jgi:hypothetical protein
MPIGRIQLPYASTAEWEKYNPGIRFGELIIELKSTGGFRVHVGNGADSADQAYTDTPVVWDSDIGAKAATASDDAISAKNAAANSATAAANSATAAASSAGTAKSDATSSTSSATAAANSATAAANSADEAKTAAQIATGRKVWMAYDEEDGGMNILVQ